MSSSIVRLLGPIILLSLAIPLALLAVATTSLALLVLLFRVAVVQIELVTAFGASWLSFATMPDVSKQPQSSARQTAFRTKIDSQQSFLTHHATPDIHNSRRLPNIKSDSSASLVGTVDPARDFEGVGGWRLANDGADDAVWLSLNSRLELPNGGPQKQSRRHQRSRSTQSGSHRHSHTPPFTNSPTHSRITLSIDDDQSRTETRLQ